ncbi:hypothetical protein LCGC14_2454220, partial [marine sediment metagenome]
MPKKTRKKTKRHNNRTILIDQLTVNTYSNIQSSQFINTPQKTQEGFLIVDTVIAEAGVLPYTYVTPSGEEIIHNELLGDAIFSSQFINSCDGIPFVLEHPQNSDGSFVDVNPNNFKEEIKGVLFNPRIDKENSRLIGTLKVFDEDVIELMESGELQEVSQGYVCQVVEQPGVFNGEPYDAIQTNMLMNHLALVNEGRAGDSVRVLFNAKKNNSSQSSHIVKNFILGVKKMTAKKLAIKKLAIKKLAVKKANEKDPLEDKKNQPEDEKDNSPIDPVEPQEGLETPGVNAVNAMDPIELMKAIMEMIMPFISGPQATPEINQRAQNQGDDKEDKENEGDIKDKLLNSSNAIINQAVLNSTVQKIVLNNVQETGETYAKAQSVLGADVSTIANRFNSLDEFKRYVIKESGYKAEEQIRKMNAFEVKAYFDVITE